MEEQTIEQINPKILIVDDDDIVRAFLVEALLSHGFDTDSAESGLDALDHISKQVYDLILTDVNMPDMRGPEIATRIKSNRKHQEVPVVAITTCTEEEIKEEALAAGCDGFLQKPISADHLIDAVECYLDGRIDHMEEKDENRTLKIYNAQLVSRLEQQVRALSSANQEIVETMLACISSLVFALEARDKYTSGHTESVAATAVQIAKALGMCEEEVKKIKLAGLLHDIGKIGIRDEILLKPTPPTDAEWELIRRHPMLSAKIIRPVRMFRNIIPVVLHHHERLDGKGYPSGLLGAGIPLDARILAIADSWHAMTSDRPYRKALTRHQAVEELIMHSGTQFDPSIVEIAIPVIFPEYRSL